MSLNVYLGIDVGSVTTKLALVNEKGKYVDSYMLKTAGKPVDAVQNGMKQILSQALQEYSVQGVGTTGSGRNLAGALVGADVVKNEITLNITANVKDGLHAKAITIENGNIDITAVMDAMEAEVNSKGNKGTIFITGGTIKIHDSKIAIKAATSISFENPVDTDVIGILLKVNNISDKVLQSVSITNKSTALTYYLNDTLTNI